MIGRAVGFCTVHEVHTAVYSCATCIMVLLFMKDLDVGVAAPRNGAMDYFGVRAISAFDYSGDGCQLGTELSVRISLQMSVRPSSRSASTGAVAHSDATQHGYLV